MIEKRTETVIDAIHQSGKGYQASVAAGMTGMNVGLWIAAVFDGQRCFVLIPPAARSLSSTATGQGNGLHLGMSISFKLLIWMNRSSGWSWISTTYILKTFWKVMRPPLDGCKASRR